MTGNPCQTCKETDESQCAGVLDLSRIVQANVELKRSKNEAMQLRTRMGQDVQLLTTLNESFTAKKASLSAATSSMADADIELLRSEIQRLAVNGKQVVE
ncbi:uncharacterized protein A1O9_12965, partial [Exophiala aquamarina CBS 119918]